MGEDLITTPIKKPKNRKFTTEQKAKKIRHFQPNEFL